eukprot:gene7995-8193_t
MNKLKLDPDATNGMADIGNTVADAWIQDALKDGLNYNGLASGKYNAKNYSDYGPAFIPANDAYKLRKITKWQPLMETNDLGYFFSQAHITPQMGRATPFALSQQQVRAARAPAPYSASLEPDALQSLLKNQTDEVLRVSAGLTDSQKMTAEWYDDKLVSLAPLLIWMALFKGMDAHTSMGLILALNCVYDATIVTWKEKIRHNAVRPMSLVHHIYGDTTIRAYAGRGAGTQDISGNRWLSYMRTMPHAEYPSGTATVCAAFGEYVKLFTKADSIQPPVAVTYRKGCSRREPGITPAQDFVKRVGNIEDMIQECGQSRIWAGVHFSSSVTAGIKLGRPIGRQCFAKYQSLIK